MPRIIAIVFAVLITGVVVLAGYFQWSSHQPVTGSARFIISPGQGASAVAKGLVDAGVIGEPYSFILWSYRKEYTGSLKAGEYEIERNTTLIQLLEKLVKGDVVTYSVTFIEGWTFRQFLNQLNNNEKLKHTVDRLSDKEIMTALGQPNLHPEGRFFPDTYVFDSNTKDIDILRRALRSMSSVLDREWEDRAPDIILKNKDEALILASIIEKETGKAAERETISAVFYNRLNKKMRLQTDPTVIYGLGDQFKGNLKRAHLKQDTPYNTYTRFGLPPTPIANPGAGAIRAAMSPASTEVLYFVSRGDGSHQFSKTLTEHNRAVVKYQLGGKKKPISSSDE